VFTDMQQWADIRRRVLVENVSKRQILRETGMHWRTLEKVLANPQPPGYRVKAPRPRPKLGPFLDRVARILDEDKGCPRKQRHTAKRIFERLKGEGYPGGYTAVKRAVRDLKRVRQEVFVPLTHRPGEAQVDFGYALVNVAGQLRKVAFFVMALPHSDALFVQAFERECTETFWEGHVRGFDFLGGVPRRITYDNSRVMVAKIVGPRARRLTQGFLQLKSHYLFDHHFCLVQRPNEKGVVEGTVKFARLNFFVPVPQVRDLDELNAHLLTRCREDRQRRVRGSAATKEVLLGEDRAAFVPLPASPFDACVKRSTAADSLSLVRFDDNDYSVPVRYAHHPVVVRGYVDRVVLCHKGEEVAGGAARACRSTRCTTWRCWSGSRGRWTTPGRWTGGSCPSASGSSAAGWRRSGTARAPASSSGCSVCWRSTRRTGSPRRWSTGCGCGRTPGTRSPSSCYLARTGGPRRSRWTAGSTSAASSSRPPR
jgi:transposase